MTFVALDTVSIDKDENNAEEMIRRMDDALENAGDDWKLVFGHYPICSGGHYSGTEDVEEKILPIMKKHKVDFYVSGHDHNLQHWTKMFNPGDIEHITTGGGGKSEYSMHGHNVRKNEEKGMKLEFFHESYGFAYFVVRRDKIYGQFVNLYGQVINQFSRNKL